ncbi:hypothetical protein ACO0QE_002753 [Hanseniaspora vineae]
MTTESDNVLIDLNACIQRIDALPEASRKTVYQFDYNHDITTNLNRCAAATAKFPAEHMYVYRTISVELASRLIHNQQLEMYERLSTIAYCISLAPEIESLAEYFIKSNLELLNALLAHSDAGSKETEKILLALYRLLYHDKTRFNKFISTDLITSIVTKKSQKIAFPVEKFLAIKVLSYCLNISEKLVLEFQEELSNQEVSLLGTFDNEENVNFKFLELNEAARFTWFNELPHIGNTTEDLTSIYVIPSSFLSPNVVSLFGVLAVKIENHGCKLEESLNDSSLVLTSSILQSVRKIATHIARNEPVLITGASGSGKTFLINKLHSKMSDSSLIKIHLGEQTDAKLLLGTYTSGSTPGTFVWKNGVLTTAVKEGKWVLVEDINKAPTEVVSVLLTLLENRELVIPSRGEVVKCANGFQMISTITTEENHGHKNYSDMIGMRLWNEVALEQIDELAKILMAKFPSLHSLIPKFIETYNRVEQIYKNPHFVSLNKGAHPRMISVRDIMKLCARVEQHFKEAKIGSENTLIENSLYDSIFMECVDCFTSSVSESRALEPLVSTIGEVLEISPSKVKILTSSQYVPEFDVGSDLINIGRASLKKNALNIKRKSVNETSFATTNHARRLMEQIGMSVEMSEPVLLVGETGTGKTTVVQQVASLLNKKLTVINVSQQTEMGDLLGGYKPVNCRTIAIPLIEEFEELFAASFSMKKNEKFYKILHKCISKQKWTNVVKLFNEAYKMAAKVFTTSTTEDKKEDGENKKRKLNNNEKEILFAKWSEFHEKVKIFDAQSQSIDNSFVFDFVEGSLVKAVKNGDWLLLDELNLASPDTLESIADLLADPQDRTILLSEKGEAESIKAHPDFRIFGCMNPATDVGKRDLPNGIRSRFSEIYVHSPDKDIQDLLAIIDKYIGRYCLSDEWAGNDVAELYLESKRLSEENKIVDGSNQKPHFSIRTLTRTLIYVVDIIKIYGIRRSLYEGFCMSFLTLLDEKSEKVLRPVIEKYTIGRLKNQKSVLTQTPPSPGPEYVQFKHYWMKRGPDEVQEQPHYIITPFVEKNMLNLVRATSGRRFPVLVQGPTSSGKTSMIKYLADITGHKFVRINNHEHTDLQEYLGTYLTDESGKLAFKEGVLVDALRNGHWIVLDELNLAPTDVLEALNRLLDDNRELFIPETQEVVHPHPDFMLFATQNPPGIYGGRKILSRAFRNRFLELHFDDIPQDELEIIIRERCKIAPTYAKKIVECYRQLLVQRSANRLFEQKNSFATLRDLFRWANREAVGYEELAANGYMLLAERCRNAEEKAVVKSVLEKVMRVTLDMDLVYSQLENPALLDMPSPVVWTKAARRLATLVSTCLKNNEPILLVGETGCGKTTICQLIARYLCKELISINAHQNTETGDILGAQRPVRNRSQMQDSLCESLKSALSHLTQGLNNLDLDDLVQLYDTTAKSDIPQELQDIIKQKRDNLKVLFEWCDGPLINAMKTGNFFLLDEISLADDSVLERLNSVLEPERSLLLAEKGSDDIFVTAKEGFQFFATMNPGGDYGKKELSPALRNRFTEIWVPSMEDFEDVHYIVFSKLSDPVRNLSHSIVDFSKWYGNIFGGGNASNGVISLRDILAWVEFINLTFNKIGDPYASLLHGASMVFIDALGTNNTAYLAENQTRLALQKKECVDVLSRLCSKNLDEYLHRNFQVVREKDVLKCGLFDLKVHTERAQVPSFNMEAPTTSANLMRVMRAMQVYKPILLEGSPGVGKTSLISALAEATGNSLTRINLSEQTDLVDLFGSDAPGEKTGEFVWRDAPFLRAMQQGEWVLLDEMNLASQSVLEGLNACLDHRGEAYIPELDKSFKKHPNFLVFAAQNPQYQGGGRKGLPKSFVNRFSVVYVDVLTAEDLLLIAQHVYPETPADICSKMIETMSTLENQVCNKKLWGAAGSPWEFNLRDTLRWLKLFNAQSICSDIQPQDFLNIVVKQRFRTKEDRSKVDSLITNTFGSYRTKDSIFEMNKHYIQANGEIIERNSLIQHKTGTHLVPLQCNYDVYESVLRCINYNWPLILVGPSGSGKSDIIKFMSSVIGTKVHEFSMNSDVDSMDILGGYEQVDLTRKVSYVINDLKDVLQEILVVNIFVSDTFHEYVSVAADLFDDISNLVIDVSNFEMFKTKFDKFCEFVSDSNEPVRHIKKRVDALSKLMQSERSVRFEWFDGMLVKAVEEGHWLILDNANLCSPSVLDRLNSLLETNGSLIINECSMEDGRPRVVKPNKNFRLFLTVDPKYGELSRAMRNRGVEVFVDQLEKRVTPFDTICMNQQENTKMLSQYIPSFCSYGLSLSYAHDMVASTSTTNFDFVANAISFASAAHYAEWIDNVASYSMFKNKEAISSLTGFLENLSKFGVFEIFSSLYAPVKQNTLFWKNGYAFYEEKSQFLNPLINNYFLSTLKSKNENIDSKESVYFFKLFSMLLTLTDILEKASKKAVNGRIDNMSYLEQSAAALHGRKIKNPPKISIFLVLSKVSEYITQFMKSQITNGNFFVSDSAFFELYLLLIVSFGAYETSLSKNEAKLRVYQQLISEWIEQSSPVLKNKHSESIQNYCVDSLTMTRGSSMSLLWTEFRNTYPSSKPAWLCLNKISEISHRMDVEAAHQFKESYGFIQDLREVLCSVYEQVINNSFAETGAVLERLESGLEELHEISDQFLIKRNHYFEAEFQSLMRLIFSNDEKVARVIKDITINAHITTELVMKKNSNMFNYPEVFDLLWDNSSGSFVSYVDNIFFSDLFVSSVIKADGIKNSQGFQINQTLEDAKLLLLSLVDSSEQLLINQTEKYASALDSWVLKICSLHTSSEITLNDLKSDSAEALFEDPYFLTVFKTYFASVLNCTTVDMGHLAKNWINFGTACLCLYVPDCSYDPAVSDYVMYDNYQKRKAFHDELVQEWSTIRSVISGNAKILAEDYIVPVLDEEAPKKPRVYRPETSVDPLCEEWNAFMDASVDPQRVAALLSSVTQNEENVFEKLDMFEQNTSQFLLRLTSQYTVYADMNDIFSGFVYSIKFGFNIAKSLLKEEFKPISVNPSWPLDILNISVKSNIIEGFTHFSSFFKAQACENLNVETLLSFFMDVFHLHGCSDDLAEIYNHIVDILYYRWSLRRVKEEEKAAQDGGLYRYNYDVEAQAEEEFKKMFPDYEEVLTLESSGSKTGQTATLEDVYYRIAKIYMNTFNSVPLSVYDIFDKGSEVAAIMSCCANEFKSSQLTSSSLLTAVYKINKEISSFDMVSDSSSVDFYQGFSVVESKKSMQIVESLLESVYKHLKEWPEHATLNELFRICKEFLNYPVDTPVARLLQKIEQIYTFVSDWEKYASSHVSLSKHASNLTNLIVSWRKLELHTWNGLFAAEDQKAEQNIGKWWFYLVESIIVTNRSSKNSSTDENLTKLLSSLNLFFSKSTYGEFAARLSLVQAFLNNVKMDSSIGTDVEHALKNSISFFKQFLPIIEEHVAIGRKNLEKEIKEVILLASWKDVNVEALKQSSRKSHNNLYKLVRKYRDLLGTDVSILIDGGLTSDVKNSSALYDTPLCSFKYNANFEHSKKLVITVPGWEERSAPLKNVDLVNKNLKVYIDQVLSAKFPNLFDFVCDVRTEADRLRKETPSVFKKEKKKVLAALKVQKRKLLSDSIKELRRMGLKTNFREDIHKAQGTVTSILANSKSFSDSEFEACDAYYFRILDLLPRMRNAVTSPNEEVPPADISKAMAISENLIFSLIATRKPLLQLSDSYSHFDKLRSTLERFVCDDEIVEVKNTPSNTSLENLGYISDWLPKLIEFAVSVLSNVGSQKNVGADIKVLNEFAYKIQSFSAHVNDGILTDQDSVRIVKMNKLLDGFSSYLESRSGEFGFVFKTMISWLEITRDSNTSFAEGLPLNLQNIDQAFRKVYTTVMLAVQKITECSGSSISEEDDKWLSLSNQKLMAFVKNLFAGKVTESLAQCVSLLKSANFSPNDTKYVRAIASYTMPVINHYYTLLVSVLNLNKHNYYNNCKSTFVLCSLLHSLAKEGFCSPEPPSETKEDDNLQDGTGLGDGEGQTNNTEGVEEDEDLLEDASTKNPDQKNNDENESDDEEKDDAMEMDNDFAGELENASDQEDHDDDENDDEQDMDEAIDDLNEDDPNAIDDKMWNEEAPESSKEKDSDKMPDQENNEDIQAGEDDAEDEDKEESKNDQKEQSSKDQQDESAEQEMEEQDQEDEDGASDDDAVGEQEDDVKNDENDQLESNVPEVDTMDLPEDMNLDSDNDKDDKENEDDGDEEAGDDFEDNLEAENDKQESKEENAESLTEQEGDDQEDAEDEDVEMHDLEEAEDAENDEHQGDTEEPNENDVEDGEENADGLDSADESDKEVDEKEEEAKGGDEHAADEEEENVEGLQGVEQQEDIEMNQETTTQQNEGSKGTGADSVAFEEQEDIGASGATQAQQQEQEQMNEDSTNSSREQAKESLKQLGDSLKEFHRRHQEIKEQGTHDEDEHNEKSAERPDEFEHIDGENTETDTQALGSANMEDAHGVDEDKAIDDDNEADNLDDIMDTANESEQNAVKEEDVDADVDMDADINNAGDDSSNQKDANRKLDEKGAFIGERKAEDLLNSQLENFADLDDLDQLIEKVDLNEQRDESKPPRTLDESRALWKKSEMETNELASGLSEQLRLILEPTLATKLRGDYKTGKRLNMKRIIPYIASQFRKDKIWLRRTKPSKRQYQIMIAVDNSKSMSESKSVNLAFQSICLVSKALTQLESGGLSIVKFGEHTKEVHNFDEQFSNQSGAKAFQWFDFQDTKTDIKRLCAESIKIFDKALASGNGNADLWQLEIILSDGVCEDHETIQRLVRRARENKIMLVFVIIDGINANESIMDMNQVKYVPDHLGNMQLKVEKYLDTFPFEFYVVVHDITELPEMLSIILRQYFSELASM